MGRCFFARTCDPHLPISKPEALRHEPRHGVATGGTTLTVPMTSTKGLPFLGRCQGADSSTTKARDQPDDRRILNRRDARPGSRRR